MLLLSTVAIMLIGRLDSLSLTISCKPTLSALGKFYKIRQKLVAAVLASWKRVGAVLQLFPP
jgi:hypothetical protein